MDRKPNCEVLEPGRLIMGEQASQQPDVYVSIAEAARLVGVSPATLRNWERRGFYTPARTTTGHRRYSLADIASLRRIHDHPGEPRSASSAAMDHQHHVVAARHTGPPVPAAGVPAWARKLRRLRLELGLSLRKVGAVTSLSASFVSSIERGQANPSVAALQRLTAAYGISIVELMGNETSLPKTLVRPQDRQPYDITVGVKMEQLNFGDHQMELHLFTVDPGAGTGETYHHVGEEFIFLLSGELVVWIDRVERYALSPGDVLYFHSTRQHEWMNPGETPAVFLGVNTPPTF